MEKGDATDTFRRFSETDIYSDVIKTFEKLRTLVGVRPERPRDIYNAVRQHVVCPQILKFIRLLDARKAQEVYGGGTICQSTTILVIGGGPCGLRTAIECALLGARVAVVEMRNYATRNNVLHLWPSAANDLKSIGAKVFYPKFCAGAIHHVSIRRLQLLLMKIALLLGVEIHSPVRFIDIVPPNPSTGSGWRARCDPSNCPVNQMEFNVVVGADGKKNSLDFPRKFTRGKVSIAITANFKNTGRGVHVRVSEIPGVISVRRPELFSELKDKSGLEFENFVYFRDESHYFIMTARKKSVVEAGIVKKETADLRAMFHPDNINHEKLLTSVRKIAETAWRVDNPSLPDLPELEFQTDRYGKEDVAIFDFAALHQAEHACMVKERQGKKLLHCIVGDTLLEPFWPTGSGIAKGFLGGLDAAWTIRHWAMGEMTDLEVIAERESIFRILPQVSPDGLRKDNKDCTIDPRKRYKGGLYSEPVRLDSVKPKDVQHLYNTGDATKRKAGAYDQGVSQEKRRLYRGGSIDTHRLVGWYKERLKPYSHICKVTDLSKSWNNGLAFCAVIQTVRPDIMNVESLDRNDYRGNIQKAFDIIERDFGVEKMMAPDDLVCKDDPDRLTMMSYLFHVYEYIITKDDVKIPTVEAGGRVTDLNLPPNSSAFGLINTIASNDALLNTLKRDARRIQTLDVNTLARQVNMAGGTSGTLNYYLQSASLDRRAKSKVHMAVRKAKTIKPGQEAGREWRRKTREKTKRKKAAQYTEQFELLVKPVLPKIPSTRDESKENTAPSSAHNGAHTPAQPSTPAYKPTPASTPAYKPTSASTPAYKPTPASTPAYKPTPVSNPVATPVRKPLPSPDVPVRSVDKDNDEQRRGVKFADDSKQDDGPNTELTPEEEARRRHQMSLSRQACEGVAASRISAFTAKDQNPQQQNVSSNSALKRRSAFRDKTPSAEMHVMSAATMQRKKRTGEICCICDKKLYIVERFCAHGHFLHRQCFKCTTCDTHLRIGNNIVIQDENENPHFYCYAHAYQAGANDVTWNRNSTTDNADSSSNPSHLDTEHFGPLTQEEEEEYMASDEEDSDSDIDEAYRTNLGVAGVSNTLTLTGPLQPPAEDGPDVPASRRAIQEIEDWQSDVTDTSNVLLEQEEIQHGLDEVEAEREELEEKGILLEKQIRGVAGDRISKTDDDLMDAWLNIAHEKKELKEKEAKLMLKLRLMSLQERLASMLEMMTGIDDDGAGEMEEEVSHMEVATESLEDAAMKDDMSEMVEQMLQIKLFQNKNKACTSL